MLIIEGPDLVGKTTLAKKLRDELLGDYFHFGPLTDDFDFIHGYAQFVKPNRIMDRFHLSEIAYGRACRGRTRVGEFELRAIEGYLKFKGCMTVLVTTSTEAKYRAHLSRHWTAKEMFGRDDLIRVWHEFDHISDQWHGGLAIDMAVYVDDDRWACQNNIDAILRRYRWLQASVTPKATPIR